MMARPLGAVNRTNRIFSNISVCLLELEQLRNSTNRKHSVPASPDPTKFQAQLETEGVTIIFECPPNLTTIVTRSVRETHVFRYVSLHAFELGIEDTWFH